MTDPSWPEHGATTDRYYPWHVWTSPAGAHHAGYLLDTVIGPNVETGEPMVYEVLRCEPCLSWHVTPLPEPAALAHYYTTTFYQHDKPDMVDRYERDREWWEQCVHTPLIRQALGFLAHKEASSFLDIGAGPGIALDCARVLGCETWGIEPNRRLAGILDERGHNVLAGVFDEDTQAVLQREHIAAVSIIYLYETLEHQPCPEEFLLRCYDLLKPGGVLVVVVPNDHNALQQRAVQELRLPRWWYQPPQHLWYWSPKTLQLQLRRVGLTLLDMRGTYPLEQHLLLGDYYVGNEEVGRRIHRERMQSELVTLQQGLWPQREAQYRANLHRQNIGREIVALAQKAP